MEIFYYRTLPHVGWGFQSVRKFPIEIKTIQRISKLNANLKKESFKIFQAFLFNLGKALLYSHYLPSFSRRAFLLS